MTTELKEAPQCAAPVKVWAPSGQPQPTTPCFRDEDHNGPHLSEPDYEGDH